MERQKKVSVMSDLPKEMIEEILLRLPVKSLLRFRFVSKSWRSLIGSKRFIVKKLEDSKRNTTFAYQRALLYQKETRGELCELSECSLSSLFHKPDIHALEFNFATIISGLPIDSMRLVGSCNGLVCIVLNWKEFVLWNPSTGISKKLPNMNMAPHKIPRAYGFGCDERSGDNYNYKVVVIFPNEYYSAVYSLKNDSWKKIRIPCDSNFYVDRRGELESGKLHWEIYSIIPVGEVGERFGLEFDLKKEVFEKVEEFGALKTLKVYLDESSHVRTTFPSLAACTFTNVRKLIIYDLTSAHVSSSTYDVEIYLESLETLDTYPQQGKKR